MRSFLILMLIFNLFSGCSSASKKSKAPVTSKAVILKKTSKKAFYSQSYIKVLSYVSSNQRQIISEIVDGSGKSLRNYAAVLGIQSDQYSSFKKILRQNLPKLIQYNEPDAFQARVQDLLVDKKIVLNVIRPRIQ